MRNSAVVFAVLMLAAALVVAEDAPAPLTAEQTEKIQSLVKRTQTDQASLKAALTEAQEKLAECYKSYELNDARVAELQKEIGKLQQSLLANHNTMHKELRSVVGAERFKTLSRRIENALQTPSTASNTAPTTSSPPPSAEKTPPPTKETAADDKVFSGPQVGEKLSAFKVRGVFDQEAGKELDFVTQANGAPIVLIFVHDLNRMSIGMTRTLSQYTASRAKDGLKTGVVWLADDMTQAEADLKRVRHALAKDAPIGISVDGREGPGSYGLNRKMMLTILVGKEGKVTANYALVQPSLQADLPKILDSVVAVAGGKAPKLEELEGMAGIAPNRPARPAADAARPAKEELPDMRALLTPVIRLTATPEDVEKAAKAVEEAAEKNEAVRKEVARISTTIVNGGHLSNYGTAKAQEFLKKWAEKYGGKAEEKKEQGAKAN